MFCWLLISWGCWLLVLPYLPWHFHVFHFFAWSAPMMLKTHVLSESGDALKSLELHWGALMTGDEDWASALFVGPGVVDRLYGSAPCTCPFYSTFMIPHRCKWVSWCKLSAWSLRVHVQVFQGGACWLDFDIPAARGDQFALWSLYVCKHVSMHGFPNMLLWCWWWLTQSCGHDRAKICCRCEHHQLRAWHQLYPYMVSHTMRMRRYAQISKLFVSSMFNLRILLWM